MIVSQVLKKMIDYSKGNLHDINHFLKVYAYAKTIGECENLSEREQLILEISAIIHDIACPLCREKYGSTQAQYQEAEGAILAEEFLAGLCPDEDIARRVCYLVGHHHTVNGVDGMDYQILLEADYLVNADEAGYSKENICNVMNAMFRTDAGTAMLKSIYLS